MKALLSLLTISMSLVTGVSAHAQFVLPAAYLTNIPEGDTQKVVQASWSTCTNPDVLDNKNTCSQGGNPLAAHMASGNNAYDKEGNSFYSNTVNQPTDIGGNIYLFTAKGASSIFAEIPAFPYCLQVNASTVTYHYQMYSAPTFNLVSNLFQINTNNQTSTYTALNSSSYANCNEGVSGDLSFTAYQTFAYITISGPKL